ncbi:MAG: hypothetical protein Q8K64_12260 [Sediminibacterium sp.]|nr:MAG: hypothetical protein FD183_631 [Chitinophagaceae bacterium]MDP1844188.1 hypothetical protein [Sediminibacterium sp.]TXT32322.1 MAG: hypothetical protein FD136_1343 [Chitinophagaceae bacterium]
MRVIKLGLISLLVLMMIATAIGFLFPSTVVVSRAVDIKSFKSPVFELVADLNKWNLWVDGMNNATVKVYNKKSAKLGNTMVSVIAITDSTVVTSWVNEQSPKQESTIRLITDSAQKVTVVQWQFIQQVRWYPWEKFSSMMNDKIIGTMIEKNLQNLKLLAEQPQ